MHLIAYVEQPVSFTRLIDGTTFGCSIDAAKRDSRSKRARNSSSSLNSRRISLIATFLPKPICSRDTRRPCRHDRSPPPTVVAGDLRSSIWMCGQPRVLPPGS